MKLVIPWALYVSIGAEWPTFGYFGAARAKKMGKDEEREPSRMGSTVIIYSKRVVLFLLLYKVLVAVEVV